MKFRLATIACSAALLAATVLGAVGYGPRSAGAAYAAGSVDPTSVPTTTVVNHKKVKLKIMSGGVRYYDISVGKGASPKTGQNVSVQYYGTMLDGTVFDASNRHGADPFTFQIGVGQVIKGWDQGVATMKVGGKRRLIIPGSLAYGPNPPPGSPFPPNATLVFDVVLVGVN